MTMVKTDCSVFGREHRTGSGDRKCTPLSLRDFLQGGANKGWQLAGKWATRWFSPLPALFHITLSLSSTKIKGELADRRVKANRGFPLDEHRQCQTGDSLC